MSRKVWTIRSAIEWTQGYFHARGMESARLDAELLLAHVLQCDRVALYCHFDDQLDARHLADYRRLITERGRHKPLAYIVGHKEFMSLDFLVTPDVLIPRPETETLVEAACEALGGRPCKLADVGTGCGNIAVAVAYYHEKAQVLATDVSPAALAVARKNAERHGVDGRVSFREGDLLDCVPEVGLDAVLSNPPYVSPADRERLAPEVRDWEPAAALYCPGGAREVYRRIAAAAAERLADGGRLMVEVGCDSYEAARGAIEATGAFTGVEGRRDLAGVRRVVLAKRTERKAGERL